MKNTHKKIIEFLFDFVRIAQLDYIQGDIMFKKTLLSLAVLGAGVAQADVLTSVKPLGFIASAITEGVTETKVLLPVTASPHDYSLKPSDVTQLQSAQLVVWVGDGLEGFLEKSIEKLLKEKVLTLEDVDAIDEIVEKASKKNTKTMIMIIKMNTPINMSISTNTSMSINTKGMTTIITDIATMKIGTSGSQLKQVSWQQSKLRHV